MLDESIVMKLCQEILETDPSIRAAVMADERGVLLAVVYRRSLLPLLNVREKDRYAALAVTRAHIRETFERKIGKLRYSLGVHERVVEATIPLSKEPDGRLYLILSFDTASNHTSIIEGKIFPYIARNLERFFED